MSSTSKIKLHMIADESVSEKKGPSLLFVVVSFVYLYLTSISMGFSINHILKTGIPADTILLCCLFISLWGSLIFLKPGLVLYTLTFTGICLGTHIYINYDLLLLGSRIFLNFACERINFYYRAQIPLFLVDNGNLAALTQFYCLLLSCITLILALGIVYRQIPRLIIGLHIFILLCGLMVGRTPSDLSLVLIPFSIFGILSMKQLGKARDNSSLVTACITGLAVCAVTAISAILIAPSLSPRLLSHHEDLLTAEKAIERMVQSGDWYHNTFLSSPLFSSSPGTLTNQSPLKSNQPAFKVRVNSYPYDNLYLKGWTGTQYTGKDWKASPEGNFYEAAKNWDIPSFIDPGAFVQTLGYQKLNQLWHETSHSPEPSLLDRNQDTRLNDDILKAITEQTADYGMKVSVTQYSNKKYAYVPYSSIPATDFPEFFAPHGDSYIAAAKTSRNTYIGYPFDSAEIGLTYPQTASENSRELNYRSYVYENYLSIPPDRLKSLKKACESTDLTNPSDICRFVKTYLQDTAVYSTNLKSLPLTSDFVEFFLEEQKKGFCTHFASAGTLMMRMFGIPARYVSGYVVKKGDFKQVKAQPSPDSDSHWDAEYDGDYEAVITDRNAHAWVEVYIDGYGWYPLEVTPGYSESDGDADNENQLPETPAPDTPASISPSPAPQKETPSPTPAPKETEPAKASGTKTENRSAIGSAFSIPVLTSGILILISIFIILLLIRRRIILAIYRKYSLQKEGNKAVQYLSRRMYQMLYSMKYAKDHYDSDEDYVKDVSPKLDFLKDGDFPAFVSLSQQAFYSRRAISPREAAFCREIYMLTARTFDGSLKGIKKLYWRYILCFL